jgi:hypothetical protein
MQQTDTPRLRVVVAGAVAWTDAAAIERVLAGLPSSTIVIHGDSPGADQLAGQVARLLGLTVVAMQKTRADAERFPGAAWKGLNERMLAAGADLVLVAHPAIAASQGSGHLVALAQAAGIPVQIISGAAGQN